MRQGTASYKTHGDAMLSALSYRGELPRSQSRGPSFWASQVTSDTSGTTPLSLKSFVLRHNVLLEGVFVLSPGQAEGSCISSIHAECIPDDLHGSRLEHFVVDQGFCPTFEKFNAEGFGSQPTVLRMLETALNEHADPDNEMFCCVAGHVDDRGEAHVYCLVSAIPVFAFHFEVLRLIAGGCNRDKLVELIQDAELDTKTLRKGIDVEGTGCGVSRLALSAPEISPKADLAIEVKGHRLASWQASWSLEGLLLHWPDLVGEPLMKMFTLMLLEARLLLVGEAPRICKVALALKALLWPFKYPHLFLSAPIQQQTSIPLADVPFPMVGALFMRPEDPDDPPIIAELGNPTVEMAMPTVPLMTLPEDLRRLAADRIARVRDELRQGRVTVREAAKRIQDGFMAVSVRLAEVIIRYAKEEAPNLRIQGADARFRALSSTELFMKWHGASDDDRAFYDAFFQTMLCGMFLKDVVDKLPPMLPLMSIAASPNRTYDDASLTSGERCCRRYGCVLS